MHVDVAVVGAGMAGIAAALEVRAAARSVVLVDPTPGGRLRTVNGLEVGPQSLLGSADDTWWVLEQLGLTPDVVPLPRRLPRLLARNQRLCALSPSPVSLLTTAALTWAERSRLAAEWVGFGRAAPPEARSNESVHDFLSRRFGPSFATHVAGTALTGVYATPTEALEARTALPAWVEAERASGSVLRGLLKNARAHQRPDRPASYRLAEGFSSIGATAARLLPHVAHRASTLRREPAASAPGVTRRWRVTHDVTCDALVVATPPGSLPQLFDRALPSFEPVSIAVVHWAEKHSGEAHLPRGFGYLAHPRDGFYSLGCVFTGSLDPGKPGHFASFVGGAWHPERVEHRDDELLAGIDADLRRLSGGRAGTIVHVERWREGFTPPRLGHAADVAALRATLEHDGVWLAGGYLGAGTVRDAATTGRMAGQRAVAHVTALCEARAA